MSRPSRTHAYAAGTAFLAAIFANLACLRLSFLSDDYVLLTAIQHGGIGAVWSVNSGFLRPLVSASLGSELSLFGMNATVFHASNLLIHAINSAIVGAIAAAFVAHHDGGASTRKVGLCGIGSGTVFAVLPTHAEPVAWVSGRTDLLVTLFSLATIQLYLRNRCRPRSLSRWSSVLAFVLALLSKENALAIPMVLLALEWAMARGRLFAAGALRRVAPYFLVIPVYFVSRRLLLGHWIGGYGTDAHVSVDVVRLGYNLVRFTIRTILPADVTGAMVRHPWIATGVALMVACVVLGVVWTRRHRHRAAIRPFVGLLLCYTLLLLPVLNLYVSVLSGEGERFVYLPSVFSSIAVTFAIASCLQRRSIWVLIVAVVACAVSLNVSLGHWRSASRIADGVLEAAARHARPDEPVTVLAVPDSLRGAFVFRNGLAEAIQHATGHDHDVQILSRALLPGESASVRCSMSDGLIRLEGSEQHVTFFSGFIDPASNLVSAEFAGVAPNHGFDLRHSSLRVSLDSFPTGGPLLCYGGASLKPCNCRQAVEQR